jgi:hypothetical protein
MSVGHERPGPVQVGGSIDTQGHGVNERHVDAHAGLDRAQLLQPLAPFQRRLRQGDEALQGGSAERVEADVVIERSGIFGPRPGHR